MKRTCKSVTPKQLTGRSIVATILFVTLSLSIIYALYHFTIAPVEHTGSLQEKVKSDYVLMMIQCALAMVVMFIPAILQRRWCIEIPNYMFVLFCVFLFCSVYLGEVRDFYYVFEHWDTILHTFSGAMLGAMGFSLVSILNEHERMPIQLSPFFVAFFSFCFALAAGVIWEIYEFSADGVLGLNMQKFALEDGTLLAGRAALFDTMIDLIVDTMGALVITFTGYLILKRQKMKVRDSQNNGQVMKL